MQIQWREGAVYRWAGALRESTGASAEGKKRDVSVKGRRSRRRDDTVCGTARRRKSERADARKGFVLERVVSCGSSDESGGERRWISVAVSLSMTIIGPPHLGQSQRSLEFLLSDMSCSVWGAAPSR